MLKNKLESLLWSLEMIKRSAGSEKGCVLKDTGGFIHDGQVDDLITLVKERMFADNAFPSGIETVAISEPVCSMKDFDELVMTKNFGGDYSVEIKRDKTVVSIPRAVLKNQIELDVSGIKIASDKGVKCSFEQEIAYHCGSSQRYDYHKHYQVEI